MQQTPVHSLMSSIVEVNVTLPYWYVLLKLTPKKIMIPNFFIKIEAEMPELQKNMIVS